MGLYRYSRLPFGVASAPAIFQRTMDTILQGLSHVQCYIDDIIVTGTDDEEHIRNLEEVLGRLRSHGITVKSSKCSFFQDSVEYLGLLVRASYNYQESGCNSTGTHPQESARIKVISWVAPLLWKV